MSRKKGFTIVELLVGLGIFSLIAGSLYAVFASGIGINRRSKVMEDVYRDARWAVDVLTIDLENMVPYKAAKESSSVYATIVNKATAGNVSVVSQDILGVLGNDEFEGFSGQENDLSLITVSDDGLNEVTYSLLKEEDIFVHTVNIKEATSGNRDFSSKDVDGEDTFLFVRRVKPFPYLNSSSKGTVVETETLLLNVKAGGLKFSYAEPGSGEGSAIDWKNAWQKGAFPSGVRVELQLNHPDLKEPVIISKDIFVPLGAWRATVDN